MKFTDYARHALSRPDRTRIQIEWIARVVSSPLVERIQADGRIRRWAFIEEENKYLRVILLEDGETVHNMFFDRRFEEHAP